MEKTYTEAQIRAAFFRWGSERATNPEAFLAHLDADAMPVDARADLDTKTLIDFMA